MGAHLNMMKKKDALRIPMPVQKSTTVAEAFSIQFSKSSTGADMMIAWDEAMVNIPFTFK